MKSGRFAEKQFELAAEFGKYVMDHPDVEASIPDGAFVFFEVVGDADFNRHARKLAEKKRAQGIPVIWVRVRGLAPKQGSRLIQPRIQPFAESSNGKHRQKRTVSMAGK